MTAELETLVVAAYVFATSLSIPRPGPSGLITDQELIALAVAQAVTGLPSDRQFLRMVRRLLPGWFAHLPDQTQFNRRLRRPTHITTVQIDRAADPRRRPRHHRPAPEARAKARSSGSRPAGRWKTAMRLPELKAPSGRADETAGPP